MMLDGLSRDEISSLTGELIFLSTLQSGWSHGSIKVNGEKIKVKGNSLSGLREKSVYEFIGKFTSHEKWGDSFQVDIANIHVPTSQKGLINYLINNYSNVGEKTATKYIDMSLETGLTLEEIRGSIIRNPFDLDFSQVTKRKTQNNEKGGIAGQIYRFFATKLPIEGKDAVVRSLSHYYEKNLENYTDPVQSAWNIFLRNPYAPIRHLDGYGFLRADEFGKALGFTNESLPRIAALATYAIDDGCNGNGHSYLCYADIKARIHSFDWTVQVDDAIAAAIEMGEPIVNDGGMYYTRSLYLAEKFLSTDLSKRLRFTSRPLSQRKPEQIEDLITQTSERIGVRLDPSQHNAVKGILTSQSSLHTITSGPGCGKTFVVEVILSMLKDFKNIGFAAPTGKAAKVLKSRVSKYGSQASTIHSMLGVGPNGGFMHNQNNKLPFDLLVCDETSMVSLSLMNSLFNALREDAHIIFLGDVNQLPSVDPGETLKNLLSLDYDHHRLNKTHRNDGGILEVVNLAAQGISDFTKLRHDVEFYDGLPEPTFESVQQVIDKYDCELKAMNGDFTAVGLLIARRKGDVNVPGWNTTYLNNVMRERYNPKGKHVPGTTYRVGDRIIIRKNLTLRQLEDLETDVPTAYVVNGDVGFIRDFTKKTNGKKGDIGASNGTLESLTLELDDGREVFYGAENIGSLNLGYALTVHAAQGSEYSRVVSIAVNGSSNFIHRGLIFTAWSRAQKKLTIIGDGTAIKKMLFRLAPPRHSYLVQRTLLH